MDSERAPPDNSPTKMIVNIVYSGDAMLGAFSAGWHQGPLLEKNLEGSTVTGSSTAFCKGLADFSDIQELE